ncbi:MAG TPA: hemolysin family protein [Blastocatellia bacterium]|nr:hemolysin family protein [Blastocatellia bacterium]
MESEIALTSIFILVLVVTATAKSALDELSDVGLRLLASEGNGSRHAEFWRSIVAHYQQFRFTLTFGIHVSIASIAILISSISNQLYPQHFLAVSFAGMILTVILFRQILPMIATQNDPARALLRLRFPLQLLWPALGFVANLIYGALRSKQREAEVPSPAEAKEEGVENIELQALLDVGEEEGIIEENEGELIQSVIRFSDRTAGEVMTPRPNIVAVEAGATLEAVRDLMIESKYSRLPVYSGQMDNIEGVIYVRDLLKYWQLGETDRPCVSIARSTYFVPETKPIDELLPEMQKAKTPMAIVINEYGGLAGLVTIEDLVEEIVGEIEDEDEPETGADEADIVEEADGVVARGHVEVGKIERRFDVDLAADDFTTVAGLVINELGHLPAVGEEINFRGLRFEVVEADERRVSRVRIQKPANAADEKADVAEVSTAARAETKRNFMFLM